MPFATKHSRKVYMRRYRDRKRKSPPVLAFPGNVPDPAGAVSEWARRCLVVPPGHPKAGQPFEVPAYLESFFRDALADDCHEGLICLGRKNAKSAGVAVLLLAYMIGPLRRAGWRAGVCSISREKASELKNQCEAIATASGLKGLRFYRARTAPAITSDFGGTVDVLSADKNAGAASSYDLAIVDEIGLLREKDRDLVNSMRSSVSAKAGKFLALSVFGPGPFCGEIVERRGAPGLAVHLYQAAEGCALDDETQWAAANPGLACGIKSHAYMVSESRRVLATTADQASFAAFDLNLPQQPGSEMIFSLADWLACVTAADDLPPRDGECTVGFDLGGSSSMTALAAVWPRTGRMECWGAFPATPSLADRGTADGAGNTYLRMESRGELKIYAGRITPVGEFLKDCGERLAGERVLVAGADRFRRAEATQALESANLRWPMEWRGQGASAKADGSHDVRSAQRAVLSRKLRTTQSLLLETSIKESVIRRDGAGNPALDKARKNARIDSLSAFVIASGLAEIVAAQPRRSWRSAGVVAA